MIVTTTDGHSLKLYIHRPKTQNDLALPCIIHIHGGAFAWGTPKLALYASWRDNLAAKGFVVIGVTYRKMSFPGPLNDCIEAVKYISHNKSQKSKIFLSRNSKIDKI